eukprot:3345670-Pleurochrysis_carterae.AAC.3
MRPSASAAVHLPAHVWRVGEGHTKQRLCVRVCEHGLLRLGRVQREREQRVERDGLQLAVGRRQAAEEERHRACARIARTHAGSGVEMRVHTHT